MLVSGDRLVVFALLAILALVGAVVAFGNGRRLLGFVCALAAAFFGAPLVLLMPGVEVRFPLMDNERSAIGDARAVGSSEVAYSSSNGGFFGQISCLASPTRPGCGNWPPGTTPFLDGELGALTTKRGYVRSFLAGKAGKGSPDPGIETFVYIATPVTVGKTGNRGFAVDHTGLICFTTDGTIPPIINGALSQTCSALK